MSSFVYDRIAKLCNDPMPDPLNLIYMAVLNLTNEQDIISFVNDYKVFYNTWKNDIAYTLTMFNEDKKLLWKKSLIEMNVGVNELLNINPISLYNHLRYIDEKGNILKPYYNKEKGNHQSK